MKKRTSGNAIASLILGMIFFPLAISNIFSGVPAFSKTISFTLLLSPFAGVLLGHMAKIRILRAKGEIRGLAIVRAGLALSYAGIGLIAITWITPFDRFPMSANESSAVGSLRTLNAAPGEYGRANPTRGFPRTLEELKAKTPSEEPLWTIDSVLASGEKAGYRFTYVPKSVDSSGKLATYEVFADPIAPGKSGVHHFFIDQTSSIRMAVDGPANVQSPLLQ
jgi:type IV pilus assembly protein PilA